MSPLNQNEHPDGAHAHFGPRPKDDASGFSRRRMLQVMGASLALASASSCRWEAEEILPFQKRPEGRIPGSTRRFATALECGGFASSLLVTSYDGRPIKIEGNPLHALDRGACSARSQAAVLDLYDPDHSRGLVQKFESVAYPRTWKEFDPFFAGVLAAQRAKGGAGLRVVAEPSSSATLAALRTRFAAAFPQAKWVAWEAISRTSELAGARLAFGKPVRTLPRVEAARTLVALDCDLFGEHPAALANARAFAKRHDPSLPDVLRVWAAECTPTSVGAVADHRLALRVEQVLPLMLALEQRVHAKLGVKVDAALQPSSPAPSGGFLAAADVASFLDHLADELLQHRGESLLVVGRRQPAAVHALAHRLNAVLGNAGRTVVYVDEPEGDRPEPATALAELVREMDGGAVECLVVLGTNPVYDAPADVDFRRALRKVPLSIHLGDYRHETGRACTWHLPRAHMLESWGDAVSWDGARCTTQPLIDPIFPRRTPLELTAQMIGEVATARDLVRAAVSPNASDAEWQRTLHDGFVANSAPATSVPVVARFDVPGVQPRALEVEPANGKLELVLAPDPRVYDGRSANNSWLQETPDSLTKMTWGNAAFFAPATAKALGVKDATLVKLKVGARELECAACVVPGQATGAVTLYLGYGRTAAGVVGGLEEESVETVGFDAYRLRTAATLETALDLTVEATGRAYPLARTTDPAVEDAIGEKGREERLHELLRETTLAHHVANPHGEAHEGHHPALESLWEHAEPGAVRWGMAIDLNSCIGCNACAVACQAENNVPVVGREQVMRGREMAWIRIDRYFTGSEDAPKVRFQPLTCQHCESAPCEQVCPVAATTHSAEGLNDMVYNRCIGTRYCANNCPFKVRRFNFFNYHKQVDAAGSEVQRMLYNPEVTIRHRGVMEKCTFCVQRIQAAKIRAKNEGRTLADGEVVSACAQTCPTEAIVFGDLADPKSRVARLHGEGRAYKMLAELNIRPRTAYLAKVNNPNPASSQHDG
ncbi:MAG: 4Fe-4S dicluster domain-containing protein [Planctomycetes bacterium]|nr:4Fe-4S dicluster domain-containing protein [Planctomycetota bacterium]